jgi:TRAP transporter TAXI family solute receptor
MKKFLSAAAVLLFSVSFIAFQGCKKSGNNLILATGGTSGTYYPYGGAIAQIFNTKVHDMNVTAQATGASSENLRLVGKDEADLAIVQNDVLDYAYNGTKLFEGKQIKGLATVATLYKEVVQIAVSPESKINSIADMKGKKISVGDAGSGVEANAVQILESSNLTFADLKASHLSFKESGNAYQDKQIDGFFVTAGIPNAAIQEITAMQKIKMISLDAKTIEQLVKQYPYYTPFTITKETYKGMSADATTVAVKATLIVRDDLDETVVYNLTKALFENQEELAKSHAKGKELDINEAVKGISVPLHPGAKRYYVEKGILK